MAVPVGPKEGAVSDVHVFAEPDTVGARDPHPPIEANFLTAMFRGKVSRQCFAAMFRGGQETTVLPAKALVLEPLQ